MALWSLFVLCFLHRDGFCEPEHFCNETLRPFFVGSVRRISVLVKAVLHARDGQRRRDGERPHPQRHEPQLGQTVDAAEAARILTVRWVVPLHMRGWAHFSEGQNDVRQAFVEADLSDQLWMLEPGESTTF